MEVALLLMAGKLALDLSLWSVVGVQWQTEIQVPH